MLRRDMLEQLVGLGAAYSLGTALPRSKAGDSPSTTDVPESFPRQELEIVRDVVGASHSNLAKVRELVDARPALAKANWDWGFGDWESALGAASHTGQRDIALYLLANGARPTLFSAAMLGQLAVVRAFIETTPGVQRIHGPHGITLMAHARAGGEQAKAVVSYLEQVGDADTRTPTIALDAAARAPYVGVYAFGSGNSDRFEVTDKAELLHLGRVGGTPRNLYPSAPDVFFPSGAPAVKITFGRNGDSITTVTLVDGAIEVSARRV